MRLTLIAAGALLTGCVDKFAQFYSDIPQYKGQKIDALIDRIGYPDSQILTAGGIVYTWTAASTMQRDLRPMQAPPVGAPITPVLATSSAPRAHEACMFRCALQVDTDYFREHSSSLLGVGAWRLRAVGSLIAFARCGAQG